MATWRPTAAAHQDGGGPHPHGPCSRPGTKLAHWVRFLQSTSPWSGDVAVRASVPGTASVTAGPRGSVAHPRGHFFL